MTQPMINLPEADAPVLPDWQRAGSASLPSPDSTEALAQKLADVVQAGDVVLLSGALGTGKTHLARALIRAYLGNPEEPVPSPTFTLIQTYAAEETEVWDADLYRLADPQEVLELGLTDIFFGPRPPELGRCAGGAIAPIGARDRQ